MRWTNEEIEILKLNYKLTTKELKKFLPNKSIKAIMKKRIRIQLNPKKNNSLSNKWNQEEIEILIKNYDKTPKEVSKLLANKNIKNIYFKRMKLGIKNSEKKKWNEEEISLLQKNKDKNYKELKILFPDRDIKSIQQKRKKLGIRLVEFIPWTKEEEKIIIELAPFTETKNLLKFLPNRTYEAIQQHCSKLNAYKDKEFRYNYLKENFPVPKYKLDQNFNIDDLDNTTYQILIGSMLGDGGVTKSGANGKSYIYGEGHCIEQSDYLSWKRELLGKFQPQKIRNINTKPSFQTPSHPIFKDLREIMYLEKENRKRFIPFKYTDKMDELGLLIWYLDDGSNEGMLNIYSSLFSSDQLDKLVNGTNKKLNMSLYIMNKKTKKEWLPMKKVIFNSKNIKIILPKWIKIAKELNLPESMYYKLRRKGFDI